MFRLVLIVVPSLLLAACSSKPDDPKAQVRQLVRTLEKAAEEKDLGEIKEHIADAFRDARGNDRKGIVRMLQMHFLRRSSIHILSRIGEIELPAKDRAKGKVLVAIASVPLPDVAALQGLSARLYELDFDLRRDGDEWKVSGVRWRRARMSEFIE